MFVFLLYNGSAHCVWMKAHKSVNRFYSGPPIALLAISSTAKCKLLTCSLPGPINILCSTLVVWWHFSHEKGKQEMHFLGYEKSCPGTLLWSSKPSCSAPSTSSVAIAHALPPHHHHHRWKHLPTALCHTLTRRGRKKQSVAPKSRLQGHSVPHSILCPTSKNGLLGQDCTDLLLTAQLERTSEWAF